MLFYPFRQFTLLGSPFLGERRRRCSPNGHSWGQNGHIYCCCADGQILMIDFDSQSASLFYNPVLQDEALEGNVLFSCEMIFLIFKDSAFYYSIYSLTNTNYLIYYVRFT